MKKEMKDYTGLSLKVFGISFLVLVCLMLLAYSISFDVKPGTFTYDIFGIFVICLYGALFLSLLYFLISVIYNQFRDKRILWGIINFILLLIYFNNYFIDDMLGFFAFFIVLISCLWYYFSYIKPKFKKKKQSKFSYSRRKRP